jgi:hypothetical protein
VNQYNPFILAVTQESYNLNVHESDLPQVEDYANAVIIHLISYVADMGGLNSATEPQNHGMSVRFLSIFNIGQPFLSGVVAGDQYEIMSRLAERSA